MNENLGKKLMITFAAEPGCWGTDEGPIQLCGFLA